MYKRILVAIDGSVPSNGALREAIGLAKDQAAQLRIVHVIEDPYAYYADVGVPPETVAALEQAWRQAGQKVLDQAANLARQEDIQAEAGLLEQENRVSTVILDDATGWQADLIVLGTHGRHGLQHLFLGSVAEGVVRMAVVPVLLVHRP